MSESQGEEDDEEMARDDVETETTDAVLMEEIETPVETQVQTQFHRFRKFLRQMKHLKSNLMMGRAKSKKLLRRQKKKAIAIGRTHFMLQKIQSNFKLFLYHTVGKIGT